MERINTELKRYGFTGFSIQPTKHGNTYQIQREDGSLVKDTLSEGETTFITFLYYLQLVKGGDSTAGAGQVTAGQPVQNTMRNIVETYFVEYGGYESKNKLVDENFADDEPVRTKMNALLEWMDQGSHGGEDAVYGESPREANARNMEVLRELFERLGHEAHYNMMMKVKSYAG